MPTHASLTGANLHEPKGAASASLDTVYVADGSGSGSWVKIDTANLDTSALFNTNKIFFTVVLTDVSTASSVYLAVPRAGVLNKVTSCLQGVIAGADSVVTVSNNGAATIGTFTVAYSGSAAGDIDTLTASANNTFTAGTYIKITTDGGSTNTIAIIMTLEYTLTE